MSFDTERFIVEIQNRPCLWDSSSNDYSDRNLKVKCWDEILNIFKENYEMTTTEKKQFADTLQKRWKSIRGCFTRELNRQKTVKSGGRGPRKSEYIFFKQLQFLQKVVAIRGPEPDEATTESPGEDSQHDIQVVNPPKRIKTKEKTSSEDDKFLEAIIKSIENRDKLETNNQDEDRLFMLSLVNTLKNVPPHRKLATKIKIMSILDDATRTMPNIDRSASNHQQFWSQSRNYHPGYSTNRGSSETISEMDYNFDSQAGSAGPPSNRTNVSDDSSILEIY